MKKDTLDNWYREHFATERLESDDCFQCEKYRVKKWGEFCEKHEPKKRNTDDD